MDNLHPAPFYIPCDDLWVITTYYNPAGYRTKRVNYHRFAAPIRAAGIPLITVEAAFGADPFELEPASDIIQVRGRDVMWMKERLINMVIAQLPPQAQKVAWLDGDILFENPAWAVQTASLLNNFPVVQPCDTIRRLGKNPEVDPATDRVGFAYQLSRRPESAHLRGAAHGQPGIAWAARRSLLEKHGLYDAAIIDGGDELISHALGGGFNSRCVRGITGGSHTEWSPLMNRILNRLARIPWPRPVAEWYIRRAVARPPRPVPDERFYAHYLDWAWKFYADVCGLVGYAPGTVLHLWHGHPANRRYGERNKILRRHNFNPAADLHLNEHGLWEWASNKPGLHHEVRDYFHARKEDE